jgi:hypothetical protein
MTTKEYIRFLQKCHTKEEEITLERNGDYSASDDCFSNFRRYGEVQFLSRLYEKFCRIENIVISNKVNSVGDRFDDAIMDLCNYAHLLQAFLKDKNS